MSAISISVDATPLGKVLWMVDAPDHTIELELQPQQAIDLGHLLIDRAAKAQEWSGTAAEAEESP